MVTSSSGAASIAANNTSYPGAVTTEVGTTVEPVSEAKMRNHTLR